MSQYLYPLWALATGLMIASQPLVNAKLGQHVGGPIWSAFFSFLVGTVFIFAFALLLKGKLPELDTQHLKWWMFLGGIMGAFFVMSSIAIVPVLGTTLMIALFIAGQLIAATLLDHYGVLMPAPKPITMQKIAGICVLAVGAYLILSKSRF